MSETRSAKWARYTEALQSFVDRESHARVPATHIEPTSAGAVNLGAWVAYVRQRYRAGLLPAAQAEELTRGFPDWEWGPLRPGPATDEKRNRAIKDMRDNGTSLAKIGEVFGLSRQRVHQIVQS
jgi:hypothetical protein